MISREQWKTDVDEADVVVGVWLFASPLLLGTTASLASIGTMAILGLIVAALGLWALGRPEMRTPEWVALAAGIVVFLSPWLLGFRTDGAVAWNAWVVGALLMGFAAIAILTLPVRRAGRIGIAR